jgi:hypothetical protein
MIGQVTISGQSKKLEKPTASKLEKGKPNLTNSWL